MTRTPCLYDDRIRYHPYNLIAAEPGHLRCVGTTHSHLLPHTTPRLNATHLYDPLQLSVPSSTSQNGELSPASQLAQPLYSLLPAGSTSSNDTPTDHSNLGFPQPSQIYNPWNPILPSPDQFPNGLYGVAPPHFHHPTFGPILYPNLFRLQPPTVNIQVSAAEELLPASSNYYPTAFPAGLSPLPPLDYASDVHSGVSDASYPCRWTEDGVICNVTVQATRSHMNRHLHASHGFGGSETQQTRCYWEGCGETMQQGSIARHMVTCHLQAKVTCPMCSKKLSRQDVVSKHQRVCPAASALR